jgi:hypothetical protein
VRLVGVEASGHGLDTAKHAATLTKGSPGVLHGSYSYLLQDAEGQVIDPHSISAGCASLQCIVVPPPQSAAQPGSIVACRLLLCPPYGTDSRALTASRLMRLCCDSVCSLPLGQYAGHSRHGVRLPSATCSTLALQALQTSPASLCCRRLDYPGIGPEHSHFKDIGRAEYVSATDAQASRQTSPTPCTICLRAPRAQMRLKLPSRYLLYIDVR